MKILILLFNLLLLTTSCTLEETSQEQEREALNQTLSEIMEISESKVCNDPDNWFFTAIGSKACGGPKGYIAYSNEIDVDAFLNKVEDYNRTEAEFNEKWNVTSYCSVPPEPVDIVCENNKAELVY